MTFSPDVEHEGVALTRGAGLRIKTRTNALRGLVTLLEAVPA